MSRFLERELKGRQSILALIRCLPAPFTYYARAPLKKKQKSGYRRVPPQGRRGSTPAAPAKAAPGRGSCSAREERSRAGPGLARAGTCPWSCSGAATAASAGGPLVPARPPACLHSPATAAATAELDSQKFSFWGHFEPPQGWGHLTK